MINKLQNCFGTAARQAADKTTYEMKKAICAVFFSLLRSMRPQICPPESKGCCRYQTDKQNKK